MKTSVRLCLALANCTPIKWLADWHHRANTAQLAAAVNANVLTLRDVLPGRPYGLFGPWTDAEQRATPPAAPFRVSLVTQGVANPDQVNAPYTPR